MTSWIDDVIEGDVTQLDILVLAELGDPLSRPAAVDLGELVNGAIGTPQKPVEAVRPVIQGDYRGRYGLRE